jgi:phosphoenolpyruvate carboxylase
MNKEQQELVGDAYKNYVKHWEPNIEYIDNKPILTQEEFINKIKTDDEFAKKWGLTIEERELKKLERINIAIERKLTHKTAHLTKDFDYQKWCDEQNIPTKAISLTYNDKTIESYE